jgi:hypothetical protein
MKNLLRTSDYVRISTFYGSILAMTLILMLTTACGSKNHPRKCNGTRGTRVPMGVL